MEFATDVKNRCFDCKKSIKINDKGIIKNGSMLIYKDGDEKIKIYKCNDCFDKNPALTNFRECEVYSRVVGYLRPVEQWHMGKKQEYKERKEYKEA